MPTRERPARSRLATRLLSDRVTCWVRPPATRSEDWARGVLPSAPFHRASVTARAASGVLTMTTTRRLVRSLPSVERLRISLALTGRSAVDRREGGLPAGPAGLADGELLRVSPDA